jgi:hypothetical protein
MVIHELIVSLTIEVCVVCVVCVECGTDSLRRTWCGCPRVASLDRSLAKEGLATWLVSVAELGIEGVHLSLATLS